MAEHDTRDYIGTVLSGGFRASQDGPANQVVWYHGIYCVPVFGEQSGCLWGGDSISGIGDSPVEGPVFLYDPGAESNPVSASDQCQL